MAKRSNFKRNPRDFYPTPPAAVLPLIPHLYPEQTFIEPCAGNGLLTDTLEEYGLVCVHQSDIKPQSRFVKRANVFNLRHLPRADFIITNPPWSRPILHPLIELAMDNNLPAWLLFDADWAHTKQARPYLKHLDTIVSVGRVKWFPDSKNTGKDNAAWYLFRPKPRIFAKFYGR